MDNITVKEKGETIITLPTAEEFLPTQSPHKTLTHSQPRGVVCNSGDYWKKSVGAALSEPMFCGCLLPEGIESVCMDSPLSNVWFYLSDHFSFYNVEVFGEHCSFSVRIFRSQEELRQKYHISDSAITVWNQESQKNRQKTINVIFIHILLCVIMHAPD